MDRGLDIQLTPPDLQPLTPKKNKMILLISKDFNEKVHRRLGSDKHFHFRVVER